MNIFENNFIGNDPTAPRRTFLLWFLAICSMINASTNSLSYLMYMLFPNLIQQSMAIMMEMEMPMFNNDLYREVFDMYLSIKGWQYGLMLIAEIAMFAGALLMLWKLNYKGFHLYAGGQIFLFCVQNFVIGDLMAMNGSSLVWTIMLVTLYALQLRYMKPVKTVGDTDEDDENPSDTYNQNIDN